MLRKTRLASVINSTTIASTLAATAVAVPVFSIAEEEALEEVVVTGSRIKRADLESASPVTVITREELIISGNTDVGAFLQSMPSASGSPIGTTTNNGGDGSVRVDLRGMGSARTLSLVNGRRTVDGGDYQTIPTNMIVRVEILKDGASAVYGAGAVAGGRGAAARAVAVTLGAGAGAASAFPVEWSGCCQAAAARRLG